MFEQRELTVIIPFFYENETVYFYSSFRILLSFIEWIFVIFFGILALLDINNNNGNYNTNASSLEIHYLYDLVWFFIISLIFFIIYTQFRYLSPDISLPNNISIRSKFGYSTSCSNKLSEILLRTPSVTPG